MVKLSILIKGIVLYIIFVLGISMLSECWDKNKRRTNNITVDDKIDLFLESIRDSIKDSIKAELLQRTHNQQQKENFIETPPLETTSDIFPVMSNNMVLSEEDAIIKAVNDRLMYSSGNGCGNWNGNWNGNWSGGSDYNTYSNIGDKNLDIKLGNENDFSYKPVSSMMYSNQKTYIPKYTRYPIENHNYTTSN
jgi:hypothetical protein